MILVDTSVWIEFFRGKNKGLGTELQRHLDSDSVILAAPVRVEILSGCSKATLPKLRRILSALPVFYPSSASWRRIDNWIGHAVSAGELFGSTDLLIASIATDQDSILWSLDSDFKRMQALGWVTLYVPE